MHVDLREERPLGSVRTFAEMSTVGPCRRSRCAGVDRFNANRIALALAASLHAPELSALQETLTRARDRTLTNLHLPHMPTRDELVAQARAMFARTPSFDEIVDRAHE